MKPRQRMRIGSAVAALALVVAAGVGVAPATAEPQRGPVQAGWPGGLAYSIANPAALPQGMNTACRPSKAHPNPVVLLNGAFLNKYATWAKFSPMLAAAGYCVFGLDYGSRMPGPFHQMGDLRDSAAEIGAFVTSVQRQTGASRVDIVGYSEGGMVPFYYLNNLGGTAHVRAVVTIASPMRGMGFYGILERMEASPEGRALMRATVPAADDGAKNSAYMRTIAQGGLTRPGVAYTTVSSRDDLVVALNESQLPPAPNVVNWVVQDFCPSAHVFHGDAPYNDVVLQLVMKALGPSSRAPIRC